MHPWSAEETSFKNACETHTHIQYIYKQWGLLYIYYLDLERYIAVSEF